MKRLPRYAAIAHLVALGALLVISVRVQAQNDPLPSWNDGPTKQAIIEFVQDHHRQVEPEVRAASRAHCHLRPGRDLVGLAPDVRASGLLPGPGAGGR